MDCGYGAIYLHLEKKKVLNFLQKGNKLSFLEFILSVKYLGRDKYYEDRTSCKYRSGRERVNRRINDIFFFECINNLHFKLMECCEFIMIKTIKETLPKNTNNGTSVSIFNLVLI